MGQATREVLHRPFEPAPGMGKVHCAKIHFGDYLVDQDVASLKARVRVEHAALRITGDFCCELLLVRIEPLSAALHSLDPLDQRIERQILRGRHQTYRFYQGIRQ